MVTTAAERRLPVDDRPSEPSPSPGVGLLTIVAAAVGAASAAAPTGRSWFDAIWCAALAALVTWAASRADRGWWLWLAALATVGAVGSWWALAGAAALGVALVAAAGRRTSPLVGALVGALAGQALLRCPSFGPFGLPSLVAAVAIAPVLWSAGRRTTAAQRRRLRPFALVGAALAAVALLGLVVSGVVARRHLDEGVSRATAALQQVRDGEQDQAVGQFAAAAADFDSAHRSLTAPWAWPARAVPVIAQQVDALAGMSEAGASLSRTAATSAAEAPYSQLRSSAGTVDLATVRAMQQPVADSAIALRAAGDAVDHLESGWLLPPIDRRLQSLTDEIERAAPEADLAAQGLSVAPGLLGGDGPRHYLVLFTNPAETRFLGGFVGSWGLLTADRGKVTLDRSGPSEELVAVGDVPKRTFTGLDEVLARYRRYDLGTYPQNLTISPDFPTVAALAEQLFPQTGPGSPIDGVLVADPQALAAFLTLTGPVTVDGLATPLDANNAATYLLRDQYLAFADDGVARKDQLGDAARATFDALTSRDLPDPQSIGSALGQVVREKRLLFWTRDPAEQRFLDALGVSGRFDRPPLGEDYLSVRSANANPSKIDTYLHRRVDYDVTYSPIDGTARAVAMVQLTNDAPTSGLPRYVIGNDNGDPDGTNLVYLSLYSPLDLLSASVSDAVGAPSDGSSAAGENLGVEPQREFGAPVWSTLVKVPAGATITVRFELAGRLAPGGEYRLRALSQPLVNADEWSVRVHTDERSVAMRSADGLAVGADGASGDVVLDADRRFVVDFERR